MERGHGRVPERRPSRGRGQASGPVRDRVVTLPPFDEVAGVGDERKDKYIQKKEVPPQPTSEMINQVLTHLSRLSDKCQTPTSFSALAPQVQGVQH